METSGRRTKHFQRIPDHWIGVRKDWETSCTSYGEALVELPPTVLKTHALVMGATGSGKTNLLHHLIAQDIRYGHSLVVLDARGDLAETVLDIAAVGGVNPELVKYLNLREKKRPLGFNPLYGGGEPYYRALGVLDAIAKESDSWGVQLAETLRNAVLLLAETGQPLTALEPLFFDDGLRRNLREQARSEPLRAFWTRFEELSKDRQAALASPVLNKVSLLFATESLRRTFGHQEPVDLASQLDTPGSITLVSLAVDELHAAGWMTGSIFLSSLCREIFARVGTPEVMRNPVRLYVDEFEHFGMREFENILAEGRRFRLGLVLAHQALGQLEAKMRAIILGNVGTLCVFRTGRSDAEALSKYLVGDPKALDLSSLSVGDMVLGTTDRAPIHVEVNAPLFPSGRGPTEVCRSFREAMRLLTPAYEPRIFPEDEAPQPEPPRLHTPQPKSPKLEDWL